MQTQTSWPPKNNDKSIFEFGLNSCSLYMYNVQVYVEIICEEKESGEGRN